MTGWFKYGDIDTRNYEGIVVSEDEVDSAPERAYEEVVIAGRNGTLLIDGNRFENVIHSYDIVVYDDYVDNLIQLRNDILSKVGYQVLTDSFNPDEKYLARVYTQVTPQQKTQRNAGNMHIEFSRKPQRFLVDGDRAISPTEWSNLQTESGELVTIDSDGSLGVKSLEVSLSPIQDLNGYDKPWVGGAGKNLMGFRAINTTLRGVTFVSTGEKMSIVGTATDNVSPYAGTESTAWETAQFGPYPAGQYTVEAKGFTPQQSTDRIVFNGVYEDESHIEQFPNGTRISEGAITFTATAPFKCGLWISITGGTTINSPNVEAILNKGSAIESWTPYSNICPISGRTEVVTQRTGKNLLNPLYRTYTPQTNVRYYRNGGGGLKLLKGVTYTLSVDESNTRPNGIYMNVYDPTSSTHPSLAREYDAYSASFTPTEDVVIETDCYYATAPTEGIENIKVQLEVSATATDYEPYNGTTYVTDLNGTVYGGTLDVVSGVLTVDRAYKGDGFARGSVDSSGQLYFVGSLPLTAKGGSWHENCISNSLPSTSLEQCRRNARNGIKSVCTYSMTCYVGGYVGEESALDSLLQNFSICYELAIPQTYQLTPQQVTLLVGENHVWSDGGEITVTYGVHPYYNPSPFDAKPLIKVTGTGTLGIGEYILTITGTASQTLYIDCETMEIYTLEGTVPTGASSLVSINKNDFPVLEPGTNYISVGSGITAVTITPRWWRI